MFFSFRLSGFPRREAAEPFVSQQLSVGDDSLGSWSNLSFEDDSSSFLHLSDRCWLIFSHTHNKKVYCFTKMVICVVLPVDGAVALVLPCLTKRYAFVPVPNSVTSNQKICYVDLANFVLTR